MSNAVFYSQVIDDMTTTHILTAEYMDGVPVDKCVDEPQEVRDYIASKFIELCLNEIFKWRFMQVHFACTRTQKDSRIELI